MSKHSSEQRSYSVDEMMEKLKDGEREKRSQEDSELVTRPDGTQVMRVRRRKRRSKQPAQAKKVRRKRGGMVLLVVFAVALVASLVTVLVLLARFNSKGYRDTLKDDLLVATGAQVTLEDLSVTPLKARLGALQFEWPGGGVAKTLTLSDLSADLKPGSFFGGALTGAEVHVRSGALQLSPPVPELPRNRAQGKLPMNYSQYRSPNFAIVFGDPEDPAVSLQGAEVTSRPIAGVPGGVRVLTKGGRIVLKGWEELRVDNAMAEFRPEGFVLVAFRAIDQDSGGALKITTAGVNSKVKSDLKPMKPGEPALLDIVMQDFPLSVALGEGLGRMIDGEISTESGCAEVDPRYLNSLKTRIEFEGKNGKLEGFHFLSGLRTILSDSYYAAPDDGKVKGVYRRDQDGFKLQQFEFESKSKLRIVGDLEVNLAGELKGTLRIGVPVGSIRSPLGKKQYQAFSDGEGGYSSIEVVIGGTVESPVDDFATKLRQAARDKSETERTPAPHLLENDFVLPPGQ